MSNVYFLRRGRHKCQGLDSLRAVFSAGTNLTAPVPKSGPKCWDANRRDGHVTHLIPGRAGTMMNTTTRRTPKALPMPETTFFEAFAMLSPWMLSKVHSKEMSFFPERIRRLHFHPISKCTSLIFAVEPLSSSLGHLRPTCSLHWPATTCGCCFLRPWRGGGPTLLL